MTLVSQFCKATGGDVLSVTPQSDWPDHGEPVNGLMSHGWTEVPSQDPQTDGPTAYKNEDFPGHSIDFNYANGSWDHTYYDDPVASGSGPDTLKQHLAAWHVDEKQTSAAKVRGYERAVKAVADWMKAGSPEVAMPDGFREAYQFGSVRFLNVEKLKKNAPAGWSGTVAAMQEHPAIDNPWALSHWMANQGDHPHYPPTKVYSSNVTKFCDMTKG
jgi:hypothetical protein